MVAALELSCWGSGGRLPLYTVVGTNMISQLTKTLNFLRTSDYEFLAKQGADTLAYIAQILYCDKIIGFASRIPFLFGLILPGRIHARGCLSLLANRLGTRPFSFGDMPTLDACVFGFPAPLNKVHFSKVCLCRFCEDILNSYFRSG
ncbi:unnamed protein product [Nyctereutes procyonoides]|uniref:(raccoon dog) hypothetical protein n=1 Tax=Nyctereutes procyonoides TaxID=34880 RepID=A0A811Z6H1_NYCPR|nr:unnamed protein product [Nyctereutes procyonoides]